MAFSRDGGASYGRPVEVAADGVLGRVDIAAAGGGRFVVTYLKAGDGLANPDAVWTARIVAPGYGPGTATPIAAVEPGRRSGRLSLVSAPDRSGSLHAMWTAEDGVRVAVLRVVQVGAPSGAEPGAGPDAGPDAGPSVGSDADPSAGSAEKLAPTSR